MRLSPLSIVVALAAESACEDCSCGYAINNTAAIFANSLETDFLHVGNLTQDTASAWIPQAYTTTPEASHGPYGKIAEVDNVIPNPVDSIYDWGGPGQSGGPPGLQLWVRSKLVPLPGLPSSATSLVPIAEIVTSRADLLYGSFRTAFRSTAVNGTCAAFFTFYNDSSEIDMELLSRQQPVSSSSPASPLHASGNSSSGSPGHINLVIQSPASAQLGYVPASSPNFLLAPFPPLSSAGAAADTYNEYRVDWTPARVDFFINSQLLTSMTANVPAFPARLHLIHWSDGNAGWSGGPPSRDAVITVSYVKAYFNSATAGTTDIPPPQSAEGAREGCLGREKVCLVPDVVEPPDPMGPNGNVTGKTVFFQDPLVNTSLPAKKAGAERNSEGRSWVLWVVVIVAVMFTGGIRLRDWL